MAETGTPNPNGNPISNILNDAVNNGPMSQNRKEFAKWHSQKKRQLGTAYGSWLEKHGGIQGVRQMYEQGGS